MSEFGKSDTQKIIEIVVGGAVVLFVSLGGAGVFYIMAGT
jgi:hypothetical protein